MPFRTRRSTRLVLLALVSAGGLLVAGGGAAQAKSKPKVASSPQTSAICTLSADLSLSPGITMAPGSGPMTSGGPTGSMSCSGKAKGAPITGPGTIAIEGRYGASGGDTCLNGVEKGMGTIVLPTAGGKVVLKGAFVVDRLGNVGTIRASGPDGTLSGTLVGIPVSGTCLLSPLTELRIVGPVTLAGP